MDDKALQIVDRYVGELSYDVSSIEHDMKMLNLPDDLLDDMSQVIRILKRKITEIKSCETKKQLKKHMRLNALLEDKGYKKYDED